MGFWRVVNKSALIFVILGASSWQFGLDGEEDLTIHVVSLPKPFDEQIIVGFS